MKIKYLISAALLMFVTTSVAWIFLSENQSGQPQTNKEDTVGTGNFDSPAETLKNLKVIVYYFHGNYRCATCRKIEALTRTAIEKNFSREINDGTLEMRTVNVENRGNEHFIQDYQLATRSVVISRQQDGTELDWTRLDRVWKLVSDESAFIEYIQHELTPSLAEKS
jgi:hypothetical protein